MKELLLEVGRRAQLYTSNVNRQRVAPTPEQVARLEHLAGPLPDEPTDPQEVLALLDDYGSPATVASTGGRYSVLLLAEPCPLLWPRTGWRLPGIRTQPCESCPP